MDLTFSSLAHILLNVIGLIRPIIKITENASPLSLMLPRYICFIFFVLNIMYSNIILSILTKAYYLLIEGAPEEP